MKNVTKKEKVDKVELVSYSIKMTIPTAAYANIQPEIIVKAKTIEQAHDYIAPHMNKLWREYYMISERPVTSTQSERAVSQTQTERAVTQSSKIPTEIEVKTVQPPVEAVAFVKATNALSACVSSDALDLIIAQIRKSVKLSDPEKDKLLVIAVNKQKELNGESVAK